jgi:hypothetical protein
MKNSIIPVMFMTATATEDMIGRIKHPSGSEVGDLSKLNREWKLPRKSASKYLELNDLVDPSDILKLC